MKKAGLLQTYYDLALSMGVNTVSYTHLDVYKRQEQGNALHMAKGSSYIINIIKGKCERHYEKSKECEGGRFIEKGVRYSFVFHAASASCGR